MAGCVFVASGSAHLRNPAERAKSIGLPTPITIVIGIAEVLGGSAVIAGVLPRLAALGLVLILFGAIQKKIFIWRTGFWGKDGSGWSYDLIIISMLLVIAATNGGRFVLLR